MFCAANHASKSVNFVQKVNHSRSCIKTMMIWLFVIPASLLLLVFGAGRIGLLTGSPPADLGVRDGRLKAPSNTQNSVSSQAALYPDHPQRDYADIEPLALVNRDGAATMTKIVEIIDSLKGAEIATSDPGYLHAQFTSKTLQFVDDAEFWFDAEQNVIQVRSAARLGRHDFGMNRAHIETLRTALTASVKD